MNLKDLARSATVCDGNLTIWFMPFQTVKQEIVQGQFEKVNPGNGRWIHRQAQETRLTPPDKAERDQWVFVTDWDNAEHTFIVLEGNAVGIQAADDAPPDVKALAYYWANRNGSVAANWDAFQMVLTEATYNAIWEAYSETRDTMIEAEQPADPEANAASA